MIIESSDGLLSKLAVRRISVSAFLKPLIVLSCLATSLSAQVRLSTNLVKTIPLQKPIVFEVRIGKEKIENFSRFQLDVPVGVTIDEVESGSGTFSFEDNKVKIIWITTPSENEFSIRMKLLPVKEAMNGVFIFRFFYVESNLKKEWVSKDYKVAFKDTFLPVLLSAPLISLIAKDESGQTAVGSINANSTAGKTPEQIRQQVEQLRKEAREARLVGEREKRKAEEKLKRAEEAERSLASMPSGAAKNNELKRVLDEKSQTGEELLIAQRVLILSHTLDSNATEIEKLNKNINPRAYASDQKSKEQNVVKPMVVSQNAIYKVQIGSFKEPPQKSRFRNLGKVQILQEAAAFKVLIGEFTDKAEAYELRDRLNKQNPGCFVVKFMNGERMK